MWTTKAQISLRIHALWSAPLLFTAWIATRFYSSKLYTSSGTYTVSPTCQFAESLWLSLSFTLQERLCTDSVSLCRIFVINLFDKKRNVFVIFGTQVFELWEDSEIKFIGIHSKRIFHFGYVYVNFRYENFHCSVIVDNMKEGCVLLENLRKLQRVVHMLYALCARGFKKDEKVRKLEFQYGYWHHDIPNTNRTFRSRQWVHFDKHCWNLFIFHHWVGYSL